MKVSLKTFGYLFSRHILPLISIFVVRYFLLKIAHERHLVNEQDRLPTDKTTPVVENQGQAFIVPLIEPSVTIITPAVPPASEAELAHWPEYPVSGEITSELEMSLMTAADRFACAVEMATFLALVQAGGPEQLLCGSPTLTSALQDLQQQLAHYSQDTLEFILSLYAIGAEPEHHQHLNAPRWATTFLYHSLLAHQIKPARERLLTALAINKKEQEQRPLNFLLLDRMRILLAYCLHIQLPTATKLASYGLIKPEWLQWLQQEEPQPHTPLELAQFIAQHTRTHTGSLIDNITVRQPLELEINPPAVSDSDYDEEENEPQTEASASPVPFKSRVIERGSTGRAQPLDLSPEASPFSKYHRGDLITARVTGTQPYGVFVEIETGIKGLIYIREMWGDIEDMANQFEKGDVVTALILEIDTQRSHMKLSMRIPEYDPLQCYKPGDTVFGKVVKVWTFGALVEVEPDVKGLIHRKDMDTQVADVGTIFEIGDEVEALVIRVDEDIRRLSLAYSR